MRHLPEFLLPQDKQTPSTPNPKAGLSEYLRERLLAQTQSLKAVASPKELAQCLDKNLYEDQTLWLDLELDPKSKNQPKLIDAAFVVGNHYWQFDASQLFSYVDDVIELLNKAHFLGGHNIIEFDLPKLHQLLTNGILLDSQSNQYNLQPSSLEQWQQKAWDTLILSCLFIPHQPSHALAKLYKANINRNDPVQDCLESRQVFKLCQQAWSVLSSDWQLLFHNLLPQLRQLSLDVEQLGLSSYFTVDDNNIFNLDTVFKKLPTGNELRLKQLLRTCFNHLDTKIWQNLGVATFVSWLRYYDKPQARRPVWISKHPQYQLGFHQAEQAYFELNNLDDEWINAQAKYFFGFDTLRDGQMQIVKAVLNNNDIPLGILPTGGGKSLTFQLPALILSRYQRQLTVVISPLKALIEDQVIDLHSRIPDYESRIAYLSSGQTPEVQQEIMTGVWQGDIDIIYLSPERLRTHSIRKLLQNRSPAFWVLDEAHTLSQWGTDFRPDFLRIAEHIKACYEYLPVADPYLAAIPKTSTQTAFDFDATSEISSEQNVESVNSLQDTVPKLTPPRISLVTATASQRVKDDLQSELTDKLSVLTDAKPLVQYGVSLENLKIWREDITAHVLTVPKDHRKSKVLEIIETRMSWYADTYPQHSEQGVAIVYLRSRKGCEEYADDFAKRGLKAAAYHSKLDDIQKKTVLSQFKNNELDVVVCTNAFGMGIDKAGIHTVIHSGPPNNIESYIQEIGRAARKPDEVGEAYLLWSEEDIGKMFKHERDSRIPNTNTLKQCWQTISPTLKKPHDDRWFSSSLLSSVLDASYDTEQLNTQIRVALLALERYGLLQEKDQQPAWVSIRLLDNLPANPQGSLAKLYAQLRQISSQVVSANVTHQVDNQLTSHNQLDSQAAQQDKIDGSDNAVNRYHLPELAMVLGYSVKQLLKLLRELVKNGHAQWQVVVRIRTKYKHQYLKGEFNRLNRIVSALQDGISQAAGFDEAIIHDELTTQGYTYLNTKALDNWLSQHKYSFNSKKHILPMFRRLGILKVRTQNKRVQISATEMTKTWLYDHDKADGWQSWIELANYIIKQLQVLFIETLLPKMPDQKDGDSREFNLDKLASQVDATPDAVLSQLETLGRLEMLELSRLDDGKDAIFFIGESRQHERKNIYNEKAYHYLKRHYEDRCQRIHVLHAWLTAEPMVRQAMVEDYFKKPLSEIVNTYITSNEKFTDVDTNEPYLKDYSKAILPAFFSPVQRKIVADTSRASLVLAGPGSGKTTVVVHRVAYLLMIEHIKPEKILILAYNRLAVSELRHRLQALVGVYAIGVTIQTFHELARQIIGMSEKDAPEPVLHDIVHRLPHLHDDYKKAWSTDAKNKVLDNARYQWLIDEAIRHLQEKPEHFQYIMVDEFQDIDASQYEMIGLLADLQAVEDDIEANANEQDKEDEDKEDENKDSNIKVDNNKNKIDKFDQRSHLMVVGDDDQNLYAFRGASIEFIQKFTQNYHIGTQQEFYLLDNYRSASNIVELANKFIELSLPIEGRLKSDEYRVQPTNAHPNATIRHAFYQQVQGVDMAFWLAQDIKQRLADIRSKNKMVDVDTNKQDQNHNQDNLSQTIAILAPKWQYFDAVQHYLEQAGITSGRYHENEQVKPINSLIGQALYNYLTDDRLKQIKGNVVTALEEWRKEARLNHLDMAWAAICERLKGLEDKTHEELLPILDAVAYQPTADVMLITYHSAKGMEFDHVYVIDHQSNLTTHSRIKSDASSGQDSHRPLYVALTRAKRTLTVLQHYQYHHKQLAQLAQSHCQTLDIPAVTVPDMLTFHRFLHLDEMVLTPKQLVSDKGRAFIKDTFCHNKWSEHRTPKDINNVFKPYKYNPPVKRADGFYSKQDKLLVRFSRDFNKQFTQQDYDLGRLQMVGFTTTLFYQQDLKYYDDAGYKGDETSHYLIVPYVRFGIKV